MRRHQPIADIVFNTVPAGTHLPVRDVADAEIRLSASDWLMAIISSLFVLVLGEFAAVGSSAVFSQMGLAQAGAAILSMLIMLVVPILAGVNVWMSLRRAKAAKRKKLSREPPAEG